MDPITGIDIPCSGLIVYGNLRVVARQTALRRDDKMLDPAGATILALISLLVGIFIGASLTRRHSIL